MALMRYRALMTLFLSIELLCFSEQLLAMKEARCAQLPQNNQTFVLVSRTGERFLFRVDQWKEVARLAIPIASELSDLIAARKDDAQLPDIDPLASSATLHILTRVINGTFSQKDFEQFAPRQIFEIVSDSRFFGNNFMIAIFDDSHKRPRAPKATDYHAKQIIGFEALPALYRHQNIAEQVAEYVRIYNGVSGNTGPIPELFFKLENAFALVNYYISHAPDSEKKTAFMRRLLEAWLRAKEILAREGLTRTSFINTISFLAIMLENHKKPCAFLQNKEDLFFKFDLFEMPEAQETFILFGKPEDVKNRGIAPAHFVRQFFQNKFKGSIAFFDVLSDEDIHRRGDAHDSAFNGVYRFLMHDLVHASVMSYFAKNSDIYCYLQQIFHISEKYAKRRQYNQSCVLLNGLYIIVHEITLDWSSEDLQNNKKNFNMFVKYLQKYYKERMSFSGAKGMEYEYGSLNYNINYRDNEYIIKSKPKCENSRLVHDQAGRPFFIVSDTMQDAIEMGYARFWDYFTHIILDFSEAEKIIVPAS